MPEYHSAHVISGCHIKKLITRVTLIMYWMQKHWVHATWFVLIKHRPYPVSLILKYSLINTRWGVPRKISGPNHHILLAMECKWFQIDISKESKQSKPFLVYQLKVLCPLYHQTQDQELIIQNFSQNLKKNYFH